MAKTLKRQGKEPAAGARFPSQVLGDNVRDIRVLRRLSQADLLARMEALGHPLAQATLSELERGVRPTSVDELFGLAAALKTTVAKLLDPMGVAGLGSTSLDLGVKKMEADPDPNVDVTVWEPAAARHYVLNEDDPWSLEALEGLAWSAENTVRSRVWKKPARVIEQSFLDAGREPTP